MSPHGAAGEVVKLWRKRVRRGPMDEAESLTVFAGSGIEGDANRSLRPRPKPSRRQVTLIEEELWAAAMQELGQELGQEPGQELDPRLRRANVMVRGLSFEGHRRRLLRVGACRLLVWGENPPCRIMDDAHRGLEQALRPHWRAGVHAEVLDDGTISVGDPVAWAE
jgi:MOSC domain-containing protein YiiM